MQPQTPPLFRVGPLNGGGEKCGDGLMFNSSVMHRACSYFPVSRLENRGFIKRLIGLSSCPTVKRHHRLCGASRFVSRCIHMRADLQLLAACGNAGFSQNYSPACMKTIQRRTNPSNTGVCYLDPPPPPKKRKKRKCTDQSDFCCVFNSVVIYGSFFPPSLSLHFIETSLQIPRFHISLY